MSISLEGVRGFLLLALGFGFVVFWHELGHFLAAKWAGVKVEQFAVGFGQALVAFRKGRGVRFGSTNKEYRQKIKSHLESKGRVYDAEEEPTERDVADASRDLGISETEYRWNWIPLGGYVKMLGQDDLKPNSEASDPRAFNRQTIGKRMVIVSAGVVMNVVLAAIGFMILFLYGFNVPPAKVGAVLPGSPAQQAKNVNDPSNPGLQVGDRILTIDGRVQHDDWTKVQLGIALADPDAPTPIEVERTGPDGKPVHVLLMVQPRRGVGMTKEILELGIRPPSNPEVSNSKEFRQEYEKRKGKLAQMVTADARALEPGDVITAVDGQTIPDPKEKDAYKTAYVRFYQLVQKSGGKPVKVTIRKVSGESKQIEVTPEFVEAFGETPLNFAGMLPRVQVEQVSEESPAFGKLLPGDLILAISTGPEKNTLRNPGSILFRKRLNDAGNAGQTIDLTVQRQGQAAPVQLAGISTMKITRDTYGLGIGIGQEQDSAVVAGDPIAESAAARANLPTGVRLTAVAGTPVANWRDVNRAFAAWAKAGAVGPLPVTYEAQDGTSQTAQLSPSADEVALAKGNAYTLPFAATLEQRTEARKTSNPLTAAGWGVTETKDFILQFYLTLKRMFTGGVSVGNLMGPLGIFQAGTNFATKGTDWLIWFLAMISANLAVVNFLPIPIVDGGLFTFLLLEKVKGKPLSPRAQAIAQYVGLALLLGIFLFVTYQDVMNYSFRR